MIAWIAHRNIIDFEQALSLDYERKGANSCLGVKVIFVPFVFRNRHIIAPDQALF